jgi:hypothetical protein
MREIFGAVVVALLGAAIAWPGSLEMGRNSSAAAGQATCFTGSACSTCSACEFRGTAQGRLLGVIVPDGALRPPKP